MKVSALPTAVPEVLILTPEVHGDDRGFLIERYAHEAYAEFGLPNMTQINQVRSKHGVLRGIHWQVSPHAQGKLVSVTRGEIFDVAIDLRQDAPTFGTWVGAVLDDVDHHQLWVPPGFGHGYYVLSEEADVSYAMTSEYEPSAERGLRWNDPTIDVRWPKLPGLEPTVSPRDESLPRWEDLEGDDLFTIATARESDPA